MLRRDTIKKVKDDQHWEKVVANHISGRGLLSRIHTELFQFQNKETINPGKVCEQTSSEMTHEWPNAHAKTLNIVTHQRNTIQTSETQLHIHHDGSRQKDRQLALVRIWRNWNSGTKVEAVRQCSYGGK